MIFELTNSRLSVDADDHAVEDEPAAEMVRDKMEHAMTLDVPLVVDVSWGRNWTAKG